MSRRTYTDLAGRAGFYNLLSSSNLESSLTGSLISDDSEIIYIKPSPSDVEVLGMGNPSDPNTFRIYRIEMTRINENLMTRSSTHPGTTGINIDKEEPLYQGRMVISILRGFAEEMKRVQLEIFPKETLQKPQTPERREIEDDDLPF